MVDEFNDWIFAEGRQVGDTGIIFVSEEGYYTGHHIMYFDGWGETPYWQIEVDNVMRNKDYSEWYTGLSSDLPVEELGGMKYVG